MIHAISGGGVGIPRHNPPHAPVLGQTSVGVHVDEAGHGPPMVHGVRVGTGGISMQRPPVPVVPVGVQVEDGGQLLVMVAGGWRRQGESGGSGVGEPMHKPPQIEVCVQIEPVGQGPPPTTQDWVGRLEGGGWPGGPGLAANVTCGTRSRRRVKRDAIVAKRIKTGAAS